MSQKSRRCPYCGSRIVLSGSRIVARAASAEDARTILCKEKERLYRSRKSKITPQFKVDE
jgi:DNA-directed RNA polymerase subunit RPC12/RpoP